MVEHGSNSPADFRYKKAVLAPLRIKGHYPRDAMDRTAWNSSICAFAMEWPVAWFRKGVRVAVTSQPTSRFWAIQWTETGIYLALALALAGFCFWRLGRRPS